MASSDRGSAKSVYAGFKLLVTHIDEDGDGICDIDGHTDKVLVYTDNSGLELFDYRIGYISGNAANNSVNLAQAIPGGSDFTLVGGDGYVTLSGNTLTAIAATPTATTVRLQYIADSRNGDTIAKTVKVHVLNGYTNVTGGTWDHLYYTIMGYRSTQGTRPSWAVDDVPNTVNVCIQTELTAEAGKNFFFYDYGYEPNRDLYTTVGDSPYTLNMYGNALPIDVTAIMTDTTSPENTRGVVFRLEWVNKQINVTDLHMYSTSRSGIYFGAHGSTGNVIPVFNITHCLTENAKSHVEITAATIDITGSILRYASDSVIKAETSESYPGCDITLTRSVIESKTSVGMLLWGARGGNDSDCSVVLEDFVDFYVWQSRDNPIVSEGSSYNSQIAGQIKNNYDEYFTAVDGGEYMNFAMLVIGTSTGIFGTGGGNNSTVTGADSLGITSISPSVFGLKTCKIYLLKAASADLNSDGWKNPKSTSNTDADLNYELNFGRS